MPYLDSATGGNPFPQLPTGLPTWQAIYLARTEDAGTHSNVPYVARLSAQRRDSLLAQVGVNLQDLYNPQVGVGNINPLLNSQAIIPQFNNQLTFPNLLYPTAFLGASATNPDLVNLPNGEIGTPIQAQTNTPYDPSKCNPFTGEGCQVTPLGQQLDNFLTANITPLFKKIGLSALALILFGFGLYFLAKSTDTGKAVINLAKKV